MAVIDDTDARRVVRCARLCAERAWRLASALLRDKDAAYDAVQQACLVAARKTAS
jgi:DNA-directed RNA polymerase specialized sigma24 family protein